MPKIPEYPNLAAPNNNDLLVIEDSLAANTKNITREDFLSGTPLPANTVDTQAIADEAVTTAKIDDQSVTSAKLNMTSEAVYNGAGGTTTSTSYTSTLSGSPGTNPSVTITVPLSGKVLVTISALIDNTANEQFTVMAVALSGANTRASTDDFSSISIRPSGGAENGITTFLLTGLTPGSTTFTLQYRVAGSTGTFSRRYIMVQAA